MLLFIVIYCVSYSPTVYVCVHYILHCIEYICVYINAYYIVILHCIEYIVFVCATMFNNVCSFLLLFGISFKMAQEEVLFSGQRQFCVSHINDILREREGERD